MGKPRFFQFGRVPRTGQNHRKFRFSGGNDIHVHFTGGEFSGGRSQNHFDRVTARTEIRFERNRDRRLRSGFDRGQFAGFLNTADIGDCLNILKRNGGFYLYFKGGRFFQAVEYGSARRGDFCLRITGDDEQRYGKNKD